MLDQMVHRNTDKERAMSIKYKPEVICLSEDDRCFEDLTTCPCYRSNYVAFFYKKDGSLFTKEKAIEMLNNTATFNEEQKLLISMCEYAIKNSNVKGGEDE